MRSREVKMVNEGGKPERNAYYFNREGTVTEVLVPSRHQEYHWEAVRQLLGGDGVLVQPIRHLEETHGLIYVDEEGMWKHPVNASLTVAIDVTERFHGPAVVMKKPINSRFQSQIELFIPLDKEYEFFKEEE